MQRDAAAQGRTARDGASPPRDFATLLAASSTSEAGAATAKMAADATAAADATEAPAITSLPDGLLALLSGSWMTATSTSAGATPVAAASTGQTTALPMSPTTLALADAPPMPTASPATADATGDSVAALAKLAAEALGTASEAVGERAAQASDTPQSPDSFSLTTASPLTAATRPGALVPTVALALPADPDAGFDDGFGTRIAWMAEQRVGHAEIRLNPEHVGPIDVRVQLDGNRVSAEFHSAHAEVRQAIEASMPRLRELLGQHGLQLGNADVGQRHAQGQPARGGFADSAGDRDADDGIARTPLIAPLRSRGLLDEYA